MKKISIFLFVIMLIVSNGVFGVVSLDVQAKKLLADENHFTFGPIGYSGNPFLGVMTKNGYGYPKSEFGLTNWLGFGYTWIFGIPSDEEILDAVIKVKAEYGEDVKGYELPKLVRTEINKGMANYFTFGTVALILPLNIEYGWMWYYDYARFRLGLGLPALIAFGVNFDF